MNRRTVLGVLLVAAALMSGSGCLGRAVGEGAEAALGPTGKYSEEKPVAAVKDRMALADYRNVELGELKNEFGHNVPAQFMRAFPIEFRKAAEEDRLLSPSAKTLVFKVYIIHYEVSPVTDQIFGPLEQVVARVEMVDKASGRVLAAGNAVGRTGKTVGQGADKKAIGLAKGLIRWVKDYSPKREGEKEE